MRTRTQVAALAALLVALSASAEDRVAKGRALVEAGKCAEAVELLKADTDEYPEHAEAYRWMGEAYEKLGKKDEAKAAWRDYRALATLPEQRAMADEHLGIARPKAKITDTDMTLTPQQVAAVERTGTEWFQKETDHFLVRTRNKELTEILSRQAEKYLTALCNTFLGGSPYPHKVPLTVYADSDDYRAAGNPAWSQGVTAIGYDSLDQWLLANPSRKIDILHRINNTMNPDLARPRVLPHELTHLVLGEYFGDRRCPLWLNEGIAQNVEVGRRADADKLVVKQYLENPDLLLSISEIVGLAAYPKEGLKIGPFYHESASFTGWVLDLVGPERFTSFLWSVRNGTKAETALLEILKQSGISSLDGAEARWREAILKSTSGK